MATLYGHGRGKARSHAPKQEKPYWLKLEPKDIEELVVKMAKQGMDCSKIGLVLRDSYGITSVKTAIGKKIQQILKENKLEVQPLELVSLQKKLRALRKHLDKNKKDMTAKRGLQLTEAKIRRLQKYYEKKQK
ncbi:MAG: 30S ribosomal protein S15 [Candidatus Pacearchaeota archaeon]|nr:30S ribosomal protein S15 [Candidatus Pacearchaeota archaeon]